MKRTQSGFIVIGLGYFLITSALIAVTIAVDKSSNGKQAKTAQETVEVASATLDQ